MALLNITEINGLTEGFGQIRYFMPAASHNGVTVQEIGTITATPQQSSAFAAGTTLLRICADIDVRYALGTNPTAGAGSTLLPADVVEIVGVPKGASWKISVRSA